MKIDVTLDDSDVLKGVEAFKKKFPDAIRRAVARAGVTAKAEISRSIAADTGLGVKYVKDAIKVNKLGDTGLQLEVSGKRIPLIAFGARGPEPSRGRGNGVSYRLPTGRGRADRAFLATMPSGHKGVYQRARGPRLPIIELFGPSLAHAFEKFMAEAAERGRESLLKNLRSEIAFALKR